jgi:hypothetical protein
MIDLIRKRHAGDGWIVFTELANATGFHAKRYADAAALGVWSSAGYELHGYEQKISRSDLKREMQDPSKMMGVGKYCTYWWVVVSDLAIIEGLAIPDSWGILVPTKRGGHDLLKVHRKAPKLKPRPFDALFVISMIRNIRKAWIDPGTHEAVKAELDAIKHGPPPTDDDLENGRTVVDLERKLKQLQDKVSAFELASGVTLSDTWSFRPIGEAVKLVLELGGRAHGIDRLRQDVRILSETAKRFEESARASADAAVKLRALLATQGETMHTERCQRAMTDWGNACHCGAVSLSDLELKLAGDARVSDGEAASSVSLIRSGFQIVEGKGSVECRAVEARDNKCGACRACWDPRVTSVNYPQH